jgi:hypothetical protein
MADHYIIDTIDAGYEINILVNSYVIYPTFADPATDAGKTSGWEDGPGAIYYDGGYYIFDDVYESMMVPPPNRRYAYQWSHLEDSNTRIQSVLLMRFDSDNGTNIRLVRRNGIDCKDKILTALSTKEGKAINSADLLGIAFLPMTDRLNT